MKQKGSSKATSAMCISFYTIASCQPKQTCGNEVRLFSYKIVNISTIQIITALHINVDTTAKSSFLSV